MDCGPVTLTEPLALCVRKSPVPATTTLCPEVESFASIGSVPPTTVMLLLAATSRLMRT